MKLRPGVLVATILLSRVAAAQTDAEHIVMGDREHDAMNAAGALGHYQAAIGMDPNSAEALWRAASEAVDLGEFNEPARDSLYQLAERFARRAVQADPGSTMAHFALAKAIGRRALSLGPRDRVRYAGEVRREALDALVLDSLNAGALHVMGMWHANVMRLSGFTRFLAKNLLGGKTLSEANWNDAAGYLERSAALEPDRIVHHLDLAAVYADRGQKDKAREQYETAMRLAPRDFNDRWYQEQARIELSRLR